MSLTTAPVQTQEQQQLRAAASEIDQHLSQQELHQLTLFKWRYTFEGLGFNPYQSRELAFLTWLRASKRVAP